MQLVEQELFILLGHLSLFPVFIGVRVARSSIFCVVLCRVLFVHLTFFLLVIALSVLLGLTASDYPFSIFKLLLNMFRRENIIDNIRTLQFICKSISNREKVSLWHVCQEMLDLHTKRQKHWTFCLHFLLGIYSAVRVRSVFIMVHNMQGTTRLYTYIRRSYTCTDYTVKR